MQFTVANDGTIIVNKGFGSPIVFPNSKIEILRLPDYQLKYFESRKVFKNESQTTKVSSTFEKRILENRDLIHVSDEVPLKSIFPENQRERLVTKIKINRTKENKKLPRKKKIKVSPEPKRPCIEKDHSPTTNTAQLITTPERPPKNKISRRIRPLSPEPKNSCSEKSFSGNSEEPHVQIKIPEYQVPKRLGTKIPLTKKLGAYKIPRKIKPPEPEIPPLEKNLSPTSDQPCEPAGLAECLKREGQTDLVKVGDSFVTLSSIIDVGPHYQNPSLVLPLQGYKIPRRNKSPEPEEVPPTETVVSPTSDEPEKPKDCIDFGEKIVASRSRSPSPPHTKKDFNDDAEDLEKVSDASSKNSSPSPHNEKDFNDDQELENVSDASSRSPSPPHIETVPNYDDDDQDILNIMADDDDDFNF